MSSIFDRKSWEKHLPLKIRRGPFEWTLVRADGIAVLRACAADEVEAFYKGTLGTRFNPWVSCEADPEDLAKAAEDMADEALEFYTKIYELIRDHND